MCPIKRRLKALCASAWATSAADAELGIRVEAERGRYGGY
jgi:hypothetical protein